MIQFWAKVMITIVWSLWVTHQLLMLVIMLNFLIAIISQSYENVMSKSVILKYRQKIQLNFECLLILDFFNVLSEFNCLTVVSEDGADTSSGEW